MSNPQKIPKDHYVPQFYLDAFAIEGKGQENPHIYQYMEEKIVSPRIKDVASERHFYTFKDRDTGKDVRDIDDFFTKIENDAGGPLMKIINEEKIELCDSDLEKLSIFFAFLVIRTPGFIKSQESLEEEGLKELQAMDALNKDRFKERCEKAGIYLDKEKLEEQRQFALKKEYSISFNDSRGYFIGQGMMTALDLTEIYFQKKHWHLLINTTKKPFITSDNPVSVYRPIFVAPAYNAGYGNGTILITISPRLAIVLRDIPYSTSNIFVSDDQVKLINKNIIRFSDNYIFSNTSSKSVHEAYKKIGGKHFQQVKTTHIKWAPFIVMGTNSVPEEPIFLG